MIGTVRKIVLGLFLLLPAAAFAAAGYVHDLTGTATVLANPNSTPRTLGVGDLVDSGSTIRTGAGSTAIIKFEDGQIMVLRENTGFQITDYAYNKQRVSQSRAAFRLITGGLRFITGVIGATDNRNFRLAVGPTVTIGVRGSDATVTFISDQITAAVSKGAAELQSALDLRIITEDQFVTVPTLNSPPGPVTSLSLAPLAVQTAVKASLAVPNLPNNNATALKEAGEAAVARFQANQARANAAKAAAALKDAADKKLSNDEQAKLRAAAEAADKEAKDKEASAQTALGIAVKAAQNADAEAVKGGAKPAAPPAQNPTDLNKLPASGAGPGTQGTQGTPATGGTGGAGGGSGGGGGTNSVPSPS